MLSVIILAKNEGDNIKECIESVKWCDDLIVIDDYSEDNTIEIAKKMGVNVFTHRLNYDFSMQRNFGLSKTKNEWVLFVDADERVSDALAFEISSVISNWVNGIRNEYKGFYVKRFDFIWGKELKHGESGIKLLRLAKKKAGNWVGKVHEEWKVKGQVRMLKNSITHYRHQTVVEFLREINLYTSVRAEELHGKNMRVRWWSIILYPMSKFIVIFFIKRGFLDGIHGFIFAIIMSFHSFLVRGKLWFLRKYV